MDHLVLQPHLFELRWDRPAFLVVAAHGERLLVASPGRPLPEERGADGITVPVERENAPELRHGEGHDRHQAVVSRWRGRPAGGIRRPPAPAFPSQQTTQEPREPSVPEPLPPPADGPATAPPRVGERVDGP